jgi:hypothetical protein
MNKQKYAVTVQVNGKKVKEYTKDGRVYIEGRDGTPYTIKVGNSSGKRVKAVITVDGFSIINDDKKDYHTGYIINPYSSITVNGFRTSNETEAQFVFSTKGDSRAQKVQGYAKDCGVIGVRIYPEKVKPEQYIREFLESAPRKSFPGPLYSKSIDYENTSWSNPNDSFPVTMDFMENETLNSLPSPGVSIKETDYSLYSASVAAPSFDLGSEMGKDVQSPVKIVEFESDTLDTQIDIYYASRNSLKTAGIDFKPAKQLHIPQSFGGYCKRPK